MSQSVKNWCNKYVAPYLGGENYLAYDIEYWCIPINLRKCYDFSPVGCKSKKNCSVKYAAAKVIATIVLVN